MICQNDKQEVKRRQGQCINYGRRGKKTLKWKIITVLAENPDEFYDADDVIEGLKCRNIEASRREVLNRLAQICEEGLIRRVYSGIYQWQKI